MERQVITVDRFTGFLLTSIVGLLAVIAVELWVGLSASSSAVAQIPDTGLQRQLIVEEGRKTNALLEKILEHLRSGCVKVKLESADKASGKKGAAGQR
ncbi:MAG TPA: hypothetical protein VJZ71_21240 [Phycisphaerae bacterium]|nr:hypothetical protein [Phycisphaerae bacterium]